MLGAAAGSVEPHLIPLLILWICQNFDGDGYIQLLALIYKSLISSINDNKKTRVHNISLSKKKNTTFQTMQLHMPESNWWPNIIHIVHWLIQFPFSFLMYIGNPQKACFRTECTRSTWKGQRKRQKKCHERRSLLIISLASLNWIWLIAESSFSPSHPKTIFTFESVNLNQGQ